MKTSDIKQCVADLVFAHERFCQNDVHASSIHKPRNQDPVTALESIAYFATWQRLLHLSTLEYQYTSEEDYRVYEALVKWAAADRLSHLNATRLVATNHGMSDEASRLMGETARLRQELKELCQ